MSIILAAIDRSPTARPVLETARLLARTFDADAEALHVVAPGEEPPPYLAATGTMPLRILSGDPVEAMCDAFTGEVDLAVVGARRAAGGRRPVGHVAFEVMTRMAVPVVVVPPDALEHLPHNLHKALVPLDAATAAAPILQVAVSALAEAGAEVVVLHVVEDPPRFLDHPERDLEEWAHQLVGRHLPVAVRTEIRTGGTARNALMVAAAEQVDLIVLAWSRRLDAGHAAVVRDVLSGACVPVLLLPLEAHVAPLARLAAGIPAVGGRP
jgi:nucleotide-binding universal stress UspA family protein